MSWEDRFARCAAHLARTAGDGERWTLWLDAEDSDFVRFNQARVRQAGSVHRGTVTLRWIDGARHASQVVTIGTPDELERLDHAVASLREVVAQVPDDPWLLLDPSPATSRVVEDDTLPSADAVVHDVVSAASGLDLVGIFAGGGMHRGFASSAGHHHWLTSHTWQLDFSLVHAADKAVKRTLTGRVWTRDHLEAALADARRALEVLARPEKRVPPGRYRAWLTPTALGELLALAGSEFGARGLAHRESAWSRLYAGEAALHPAVRLAERVAGSTTPGFQGAGFVRPEEVVLVDGGRARERLVSPRSAVELGLSQNGASDDESTHALDVAAGSLAAGEVASRLGTGVWVSNLWYTNWSDRNAARVTGMTRFATFWVEDGVVVAPLAVMRFDDSLYDLLGARLEGLGAGRELHQSTMTYGWRSTDSMRLPGALVRDLVFTL